MDVFDLITTIDSRYRVWFFIRGVSFFIVCYCSTAMVLNLVDNVSAMRLLGSGDGSLCIQEWDLITGLKGLTNIVKSGCEAKVIELTKTQAEIAE